MISIYDMNRLDYKYVAEVGNNYALYDNGMLNLIARPLLKDATSYRHFEVLRTEPSHQKKESVQLKIPFSEYSYENVFKR